MTKRFLILLGLIFMAASAHAGYLAVGESGELVPENTYRAGVAPEFIFNEGGGTNIDALLDYGYNDSTSFRVQAGAGKVDFHMGAGVKYVPFPDVDNQPAIGVKGSVWYARYQDDNIFTVQVAPLVSRKVQTEQGQFVPYAAIPINFNSGSHHNDTGSQFALGSDWQNPDWPNVFFNADLALNMSHSFSALTLSASFPFDAEKGFKRRK